MFFLFKYVVDTEFNKFKYSGRFGISSYINAFTSVYPSCQITACFFHVSQCLWRKIQQEGLQTIYSTDVDFAVNAKMLAALAFVPLQDIVKAFEELINYLPESILPIADYFEDNFIGRLYIINTYTYIYNV